MFCQDIIKFLNFFFNKCGFLLKIGPNNYHFSHGGLFSCRRRERQAFSKNQILQANFHLLTYDKVTIIIMKRIERSTKRRQKQDKNIKEANSIAFLLFVVDKID